MPQVTPPHPPAPAFAVVGHPNKGKSSLVATLARDDSVRISPEPGTTVKARHFPMRLERDGRTLYTLIDTPGFQRARAALDWMREHETDAASRPAAVARFVREHRGTDRFTDECELLGPLVEGAAILYVVDGAHPYGPEYDAEMEVLRWTGRPSMAVINPIGAATYADSWRDALGQFFKVVRVVDAVHAPFEQQINLLRAFAQLDEAWRPMLEEAVAALLEERSHKQRAAAKVIAELLADAVTWQEVQDIDQEADPEPHKVKLRERYRGHLRQMEREAREAVQELYQHDKLDRHEPDIEVLSDDLFSSQTWRLFGLKKRDLLAIGVAGGALMGGAIDAAMLGASFLTGTAIGAVAGGAAAYFGSDKLADVKLVMYGHLGRRELKIGPMRNVQFPFVLLNRAALHQRVIAARTHAQRDRLELGRAALEAGELNALTTEQRRAFGRLFAKVQKTTPGSPARLALVAELAEQVEAIIVP